MFLIKKSRSADAQCWAVTLCDWKKQPPEFSIQTFLKILQYSRENTIVKFLRTPNFKNICVRLLLNVAKCLRTPFPQNTSGRLLVTLRLVLFVVLSWPPKIWFDRWFFIFLFMVTSRGIRFMCSAVYTKRKIPRKTPVNYKTLSWLRNASTIPLKKIFFVKYENKLWKATRKYIFITTMISKVLPQTVVML